MIESDISTKLPTERQHPTKEIHRLRIRPIISGKLPVLSDQDLPLSQHALGFQPPETIFFLQADNLRIDPDICLRRRKRNVQEDKHLLRFAILDERFKLSMQNELNERAKSDPLSMALPSRFQNLRSALRQSRFELVPYTPVP